jgi:hypothetical protein
MLNISGSEPGKNDTVMVQAEGKTGEQVQRDTAMAKSLNEFSKQMGQVPERDQAQKYDGSWKPLSAGSSAGSVKNVGV